MSLTAFVDNQSITVAAAVGKRIAAVRQGMSVHLDIASGFFDLPGFLRLLAVLQDGDTVQLLLGAEPPREADLPPPRPGDPTGPERFADLLAGALARQSEAIAQSRDRLPFDADTDAGIGRLHGMLERRELIVRRLESQFLPARGILLRSGGGAAFVGEANLTAHGLTDGPTIVLGHSGSAAVSALWSWFDAAWAKAETFDLAALFPRLTGTEQPYLIFLRTLYALFGEDTDADPKEGTSGVLPITTFQTHGVNRAERIIERYGGVLIADGVGLGKTFTAGEIIRKYRERRQRVLLVCPATLRDGSWKQFQDRFDLRFETLSYEELAGDVQFGGSKQTLAADLNEYQLVVVDEAHNYRTPDAPKRAGVLRQLLGGAVPKDVVLLTATPVNNSLWDLYHLLGYFLKSDGALADRGVPSLREPFDEAMKEEPDSLNPDTLWPILDATTVKRTRQFVKKHYQNERIKLLDGREVPLTFPQPKPSSIKYKLDAVLPGFISVLEQALMPPVGKPRLALARYQPEKYQTGADSTEGTVIGLLRSALLKRFESSVHAFGKTIAKMVKEHEFFLKGLADGVVYTGQLLRELSAADDEDADDLLEQLAEKLGPGLPATDYDVKRLKKDVESDLALLRQFQTQADSVQRDDDPKLEALANELAKIADEAERDGVDAPERRRNRKVLVFSYFSDTVDWVYEYLEQAFDSDPRLATYKGRLAAVTGGDSAHGMSREAAVAGFAPETGAGRGKVDDKFDVLVTTDVLAEGLNLQMCRNIVNYDLPWNPMRLVQRHGRVDRIGSPHPRVFLRTFFPDQGLDRLLELEHRVKSKLARAAASVGVESAPIEDAQSTDRPFSESRSEIEKLLAGDASLYEAGGPADVTQSSEEYRHELRKALLRMGDRIRQLPWRSGSGIIKGPHRGYVFTATVGQQPFVRFVPFGATDPKDITPNDASCLRQLECSESTPRVMSEDLLGGAFGAWMVARRAIHADWQRDTDPANIQPKIPPFLRDVAAFLRKYPPADITPETLGTVIATISSRIPRREEILLRQVFGAEYGGNKAKATAVVKAIRESGLKPAPPRAPLPPIGEEEIHLICWMAIESINATDLER